MEKLESIARVERATKQKKENTPQSINILEGLEEKINNSSTQYEVEDIINEYNYELALDLVLQSLNCQFDTPLNLCTNVHYILLIQLKNEP